MQGFYFEISEWNMKRAPVFGQLIDCSDPELMFDIESSMRISPPQQWMNKQQKQSNVTRLQINLNIDVTQNEIKIVEKNKIKPPNKLKPNRV